MRPEGNPKEIRRKLLDSTKKSIMENFIFCAVLKFEYTEHFLRYFVQSPYLKQCDEFLVS